MDPTFHVVLHAPEIPPNTGNIARTCVATGAKLWLVKPLGFVIDDHHLKRAGCDYWEFLTWEVVDDWATLGQKIPLERAWLFTKRGTTRHHEIQYTQGDVLVFGSESKGLPPSILDAQPDRWVRFAMRNEVRSLNLSNAVAIAVYEGLRQIGWDET